MPIAVSADVSVVKAIAGKDFLSVLYLHVNSAAICCASAALHPLPQIKTLWPDLMASSITFRVEF